MKRRHGILATNPGRVAMALAMLMYAAPAAGQPPASAASGAARTVTLPLAEYNRLLDAASPAAAPPAAPVPATVAAADIQVRVDDSTARGVIQLQGDVLREGVQRVPLMTGATVLDASTPAGPLPLVADGPVHAALLAGPAPFAVTLEWGAPLVFTQGRASFTLPIPASGSARATIDLPGEGADVRLSSGLVIRRTTDAGRTIVEAVLESATPTEVSWSMRDRAAVAAARESRTLADVFTLVTIGESDVRMVALVELSVLLGEPADVDLQLPAGYDLVSVHGTSFDTWTEREGVVSLSLTDPAARRHQFVVRLERPHESGSFSLENALLTLPSVQRERGEVAIGGTATLELRTTERDDLLRIDVRELSTALQSLASGPILSGFRYQRAGGLAPVLALAVRRFGDVGVLAAFADRATATTLVSPDGRALTEIVLQIRNRAQPFLKVSLPAGATIVSVEVAGQLARPALGADGTRVPLLRPGFRPEGPYQVSFVYLHDGEPFARKGDRRMALPRLDIPVGIVEWEVFVPDRYRAQASGGNVIARTSYPGLIDIYTPAARPSRVRVSTGSLDIALDPRVGVIAGRVSDELGAALPGATVSVASPVLPGRLRTTTTESSGEFRVTALPPGVYSVTLELAGFVTARQEHVLVTGGTTTTLTSTLSLGAVHEMITVTAEAPTVDVLNARQSMVLDRGNAAEISRRALSAQAIADLPTQRVIDLQSRAVGILPVRMDVPRVGTSHKFIRPLVVDEETVVTLRYRRR